MVTRQEIIRALPPVQARRDVITDDQDTKDIMREVLEAHGFFSRDYDRIAPLFANDDTAQLYADLFAFCKKNIRYVIENNNLQTTRSPAALVGMGQGDCKHYAGFIGGILDALNRRGHSVNWCYRFASYNALDPTPQHVFVVVKENGRELWIDPVLDELDKREPRYYFKQDKKAKMLQRIYGAPSVGLTPAGGMAIVNRMIAANYASGMFYFQQIFGQNINAPIKFFVDGTPFDLPVPAHILREQGNTSQIQAPPQGLQVQYVPTWKGLAVRSDMLRPIITPDRKMFVATPDGNMYDFRGQPGDRTIAILCANNNHLLDLLVAATGAIQLAYQPYPDCETKQRFYDSMIRLRNMDFMQPREIKTFAGSVWQGIKDGIAVIGHGFIKFIGIIPRTAFLQMLRLNIKGTATHLWQNMQNSATSIEIRRKWEGFGGAYNILENAARDGSTKRALLGIGNVYIGTNHVGEPITAAAVIASAAPVIALLAKFLKSTGNPELNRVVDSAVDGMNTLLKAAGEDPISVSESMGGKPVEVQTPGGGTARIPADPNGRGSFFDGIMTWMQDNPMEATAIGGGLVFVGYKALKRR
jgi:hypothetical protein